MRLLPGILFAIAAIVSIAVGLWVLISAAESITLRCARADNSCTLTSARIRGSTTRNFALSEVRQATVQESTNSAGGASRTSYRVALELATGLVPVGEVYSPGQEEKQRIAADFNAFLANQQQAAFEYSTAARNLYLIGLAVLGVGGIFAGIAARQLWALRQPEVAVPSKQVSQATAPDPPASRSARSRRKRSRR